MEELPHYIRRNLNAKYFRKFKTTIKISKLGKITRTNTMWKSRRIIIYEFPENRDQCETTCRYKKAGIKHLHHYGTTYYQAPNLKGKKYDDSSDSSGSSELPKNKNKVYYSSDSSNDSE